MIDFWKGNPSLERRLERVMEIVREAIDSPAFPLKKAVTEAVLPSGKLLRPALLIIGAGFGKGVDPKKIERLAAAIELLHVATLIHDDIIDEAPIRRGRPSLHSSAGTKQAVLAGDWLFSRCFLLSSESAEPDNARGLSRLIAAVCSAEISQDLARFAYSDSVRGYLRTIAGKTAALFSLAPFVGASEAKAGKRVEESLRRAGYGIGMAFQIIDDILDFESDEIVMRKPVGKDIADGLCTLPLVYALRADGPAMRAILPRGPIADPREDTAAKAAESASLAVRLGGAERARAEARRFTARALREIGRLPRSSARDELAALAERLLHRSY